MIMKTGPKRILLVEDEAIIALARGNSWKRAATKSSMRRPAEAAIKVAPEGST
jgi:hypothetical protein